MSDELLNSLRASVVTSPDDVPLRLHLAELLLAAGETVEALGHAQVVLAAHPGHPGALALLGSASRALQGLPPETGPDPCADPTVDVDWDALEADVGSQVPAPFATSGPVDDGIRITGGPARSGLWVDVELPTVRLADVGGMDAVKQRLHESFIEPMRHPQIARAFGKSLRGGLLLYGPPGCGKTYVARAVAGELGTSFITVGLPELLDQYVGSSEKNIAGLFAQARVNRPTVVFLDEVDAIAQRRSGSGQSGSVRSITNQLLAELDSMAGNNDGVFVLAATNQPWDLDPAFLRPGRLDRALLVTPPDPPARHAILRHHLEGRPIAGIDLNRLVARTDGFSGADLEHLCASAAEKAMVDSIASGQVRPITMADLTLVLREIRPSTTPWLESARNVVAYANQSGSYDDLAAYLASRGMR